MSTASRCPPTAASRSSDIQAINASLQAPDLRDRLRADTSSGPILSPEAYGGFMRKQAQVWKEVITPLELEMTQ